ncbi:MAG: DUF3280 domain-containing protein [Candidatus Eremiobacteraeota bacterium]|nr:DUF3280 domain-containing protein [Candidatus Eremiobacteraeota bacterium]
MKNSPLQMTTLFLTLFVAALPLQSAARPLAQATPRISVAVLPLAPADTYLPYAPIPSSSELGTLTRQLTAGVAELPIISLSRASVVNRALARRGYQQDSLARSCIESSCARQIGAADQARVVVFGTVTRLMAVIWSTEIHVVDVASGNELGQISGGYKGDYNSMVRGEHEVGAAAARLIARKEK